ncbi:cytochrome P450 81E8-like isoform X2 [Momordica charantia]|uniref:Cytochrome P450 81E8-like isoform X2 n=1 Tax=Momordica charantia TaxID=3673 RepID=A0A6J1D806_MOMCH|nr:cytochrome P450 81E8-like isoform X2 [Momordica charantia]
MDSLSVFALLLFALASILFRQQIRAPRRNLPPSPPSVPIIGHLRLLRRPVHRNFQKIAAEYGPIFSLRFGSRLAVVVSSLDTAEECLTKNDVVFANRPRLIIGKHLGYNHTTMAAAPYGAHWRNLRRLTASELFSTARLGSSLSIRKEEIRRVLLKLRAGSGSGSGGDFAKAELKSMFSEVTFNVVMRMVAGKRYYGEEVSDEAEAREFSELMEEISCHGGASNWVDFMPILRWIGCDGGYERNLAKLMKRTDKFMEALVEEARHNKKNSAIERKNCCSLLDRLLELQESEPQYYTDQIVKGLVLVLLRAGTDSTSVTMNWAMTQLLNNPEVLTKAKAELDTKVGQDRLVDESDLANLKYLQAIVFETLRLHPPAPMLIAHYSSSDCTVAGYHIPHDTILLVNAWAIHRDPKLWDDPTSFRPERFLGSAANELLSNKLIAFGLGRRACPGATMGERFVGLTLALMIQCYEWKKSGEENIDMGEGGGITILKAKPLEVMCKARPVMDKVHVKA